MRLERDQGLEVQRERLSVRIFERDIDYGLKAQIDILRERKRDYKLGVQRDRLWVTIFQREIKLGVQREQYYKLGVQGESERLYVRGLKRDIGGQGFIERDRLGFMGYGLRQIDRQIDRVREQEREIGG